MNASPTIDPTQQQLDNLNNRTGSIEIRLAQIETSNRHIADELHGYLTNVALMGQKHGKLEEKIDGLREQQRVQHEKTSAQLTDLAEGLKPLTDAFSTPDAAEGALKGLAKREAMWADIWQTMMREAAGWTVKGVIGLIVAGLVFIMAEKLGVKL